MIYLDTNIIIYAIENHPLYGNSCRKILLDIETGRLKASASMFLLVETISALIKINKILKKENKKQLEVNENITAILSYPLIWLDLNFPVIKRAAEYEHKISAADYVHIATMELNSIKKIISADREFDEVDFIKRVDPLDYE